MGFDIKHRFRLNIKIVLCRVQLKPAAKDELGIHIVYCKIKPFSPTCPGHIYASHTSRRRIQFLVKAKQYDHDCWCSTGSSTE